MKQGKNFLCQGDTFELESVQYMFDQDRKLNMFTLVRFSNSTKAKIVNGGNNRCLTSKVDGKRFAHSSG